MDARHVDRWRVCDPHAMATRQSPAAIEFAFAAAKEHIVELHESLQAVMGAMDDGSDEPILVRARAALAIR